MKSGGGPVGSRIGKHLMVTTVAWFAGKFSYRRTCEDMIIKSPSQSPFAISVRKRHGIIVNDGEELYGNSLPPSEPYYRDDEILDPTAERLSRDMKPFYEKRDMFRSRQEQEENYDKSDLFDQRDLEATRDDNMEPADGQGPPKPVVTYDHLRYKNRVDSMRPPPTPQPSEPPPRRPAAF
jgi:hypothetical protein